MLATHLLGPLVRPPARSLACAAALVMITACPSERTDPARRDPAPAPAAQAAPSAAPRPQRPLRIALSAAFVSEHGVPVYRRIVDYLEDRLGRDIEFVTGLGYDTINDMLNDAALDVAFVSGMPYVLLHDQPGLDVELLAAPVMKAARYQGKPVLYSDLIVRKDSDIQSIHDLRGRTYVYNEETSNSGYNMPRARLLELGLTNGFFGKVVRSGSHEESMRMVADGRADASYVDSLVLEYDLAHGLGGADRVRVVESLGPSGIPPVIARSDLPEGVREELRRHLLSMHEDPEGRSILDQAMIDRFVRVDDSNYDDIRERKNRAEAAGFQHLK
jgi:phosphonate transport system substrate-binding protein